MVHRINRDNRFSLYSDPPQWTVGENDTRILRSSLPILNISSYLEKRPGLAFIVYRDYDGEIFDDPHSEILPVKHTSESIEPITAVLTHAIFKYMESEEKILGVLDDLANDVDQSIKAPYLMIYHSRHRLNTNLEGMTSQERLQFQVVLDYVLSEYGGKYAIADALLERGKITPEYLQYLFKLGDILVEGRGQNVRGVASSSWLASSSFPLGEKDKLTRKGKAKQRWEIRCWSWSFSGVFSRQNHNLILDMDANDSSEVDTDELSVRPLAFVDSAVANLLQRRGELFWKFRIKHFVSYHQDECRGSHHSGDDRYMIDLNMYHELHSKDMKKACSKEVQCDDLGAEAMECDTPPDDKFVFLLPSTIKGFNLKTKKWLDLQVDKISLVLDNKTKGLIEALVSNQLEADKSTDLISGKGNGLILLLHEPEQAEQYLESVLNLGKTWDCVVLLDEADVFLEQRSLEDLQRNALVSVFLRVLEYHDGILILTSNRVGTFDEAFKSRIQLALHYTNLSKFQRGEKNIDFNDLRDHEEQLAEHKMNGRQIRNAITTARQYAKWKKQPLDYLLLKDIIETAGKFDKYIEKLNGGFSHDHLAEEEGIRLSAL
ncbi:hypothetical protein BGZ60DRAFT_506493 [Tricladium varicosporioides]|nr:hypothetical protein BGZ60DRAFT_506493 [Hymenoscyphus varicosporioides]